MGFPALALPLAVAAALVFVGGFFPLFDHALKASKKTGLLRAADEAEKRAAAARRGSLGHRRETAKAGRLRRVLDAVESPGRYLAVTGFWARALWVCAAVVAGMGVELLPASLPPRFAFGPTVGLMFRHPEPSLPRAAYAAVCVAAIVALILVIDRAAKSVARSAPERVASALLVPVKAFALPIWPFLFAAGKIGGRLRGAFPAGDDGEGMTEDDLRHALIEGEKSGVVESKERAMVEGVFYLGDRPLGAFMTHRSEVRWLDVNAAPEEVRAKVLESKAQRCFPVTDGAQDAIVGAAYREDVILDLASESPAGLRAAMRKPSFAPETMPALKAFESFRRGEADFLFVMDEYGGFAGMVSAWSLMEKIVGELAAPAGEAGKPARNEDGTWTASGALSVDEAADMLSLPGLAAPGDYHTLAGLVLSLAGELPGVGDSFAHRGHVFTVLAMDGNRIDKVGIARE